MKIFFAGGASLSGMATRERLKLQAKIEALAMNPRGQHGKWLKPFTVNTGRIRQGDWRALYIIDWEHETLTITAIGNRSKIYRRS